MLTTNQLKLLAQLNMREAAHMRLVFECANAEQNSEGDYILRKAHLDGFREGVFACCKVSVNRQATEASMILAEFEKRPDAVPVRQQNFSHDRRHSDPVRLSGSHERARGERAHSAELQASKAAHR